MIKTVITTHIIYKVQNGDNEKYSIHNEKSFFNAKKVFDAFNEKTNLNAKIVRMFQTKDVFNIEETTLYKNYQPIEFYYKECSDKLGE